MNIFEKAREKALKIKNKAEQRLVKIGSNIESKIGNSIGP